MASTTWSLHPTLTSNYFGILIPLAIDALPPPALPPPRFKTEQVNWTFFTTTLEEARASSLPRTNLEDYVRHFIAAFQCAAKAAIPITKQPDPYHKDHWIHDERVKELNHHLNTARKAFLSRPASPNRKNLQAEARHASTVKGGRRPGSRGAVALTLTPHLGKCGGGYARCPAHVPRVRRHTLTAKRRQSVSCHVRRQYLTSSDAG